jgi:putative FmdB family regulatory protein
MFYDFECPRCGRVEERDSYKPLPNCPECGDEMFRIYTVPSINISGGTQRGFYGSGPHFDERLGCMVKDDREASKIAKRRGLTVREPDAGEAEGVAELKYVRKAKLRGAEAKEAQREIVGNYTKAIKQKESEIVTKKLGELKPAGLDIGS